VHFDVFLRQPLRQIIYTVSTLFTVMKTIMTNFRPRLTKYCRGCIPGVPSGVDALVIADLSLPLVVQCSGHLDTKVRSPTPSPPRREMGCGCANYACYQPISRTVEDRGSVTIEC